MKADKSLMVQVTHHYDAPPERVFDAWLDPRMARKFFFATPSGKMVRAETDPHVGGSFNFTEQRDGKDVAHTGTYLEVDRPRELIFLFSADGSEPGRVTVEIVPDGHGSRLTLSNELKPEWEQYAKKVEEGWSGILEGLAKVLP